VRKETEGRKLVAEAQGLASTGFQAVREHELKLQQLNVYAGLVQNKNVKIHTSTENTMGLVPENNMIHKMVVQGMESLKLKCAEWAVTAGKNSGVNVVPSETGVLMARPRVAKAA